MAEYNLDDILMRRGLNPNKVPRKILNANKILNVNPYYNSYIPGNQPLLTTSGKPLTPLRDATLGKSIPAEIYDLPEGQQAYRYSKPVDVAKELDVLFDNKQPKSINIQQNNLSSNIKPKKPMPNASYKLGGYDKLYNKLVTRSPIFKYAPVATDLYDVSAGNYKMRHGHPFIGAAQTGLGIAGLGLDAAAALAMATGLGAPEGAGALIAKEAGKQAIKVGGKRALGWAAKKYGSLAGKRQLASMGLDAPVYIPEVYNFIKELTTNKNQNIEEIKDEESSAENTQPTQPSQPTQPQQNVYYPSQQTTRAYDNVGQMMQNMYNSPDYRPPRYEDDDVEIWEE